MKNHAFNKMTVPSLIEIQIQKKVKKSFSETLKPKKLKSKEKWQTCVNVLWANT